MTMRDGKDKTVAALLAFFLGYFGVHRFYLGHTGSGILRFFFCWTFIPAILGFFEGVGLLLMDQRRFDRKYNDHLLPSEAVQVVYLPSAHGAAAAPAPAKLSMDEMKKALEDLQEMHIAGLITDEEFEAQRQRVLQRFG
jgi:TM2 domain-containing membrane protein YozV